MSHLGCHTVSHSVSPSMRSLGESLSVSLIVSGHSVSHSACHSTSHPLTAFVTRYDSRLWHMSMSHLTAPVIHLQGRGVRMTITRLWEGILDKKYSY